jgi:hypothetical protein
MTNVRSLVRKGVSIGVIATLLAFACTASATEVAGTSEGQQRAQVRPIHHLTEIVVTAEKHDEASSGRAGTGIRDKHRILCRKQSAANPGLLRFRFVFIRQHHWLPLKRKIGSV